MNCNPWNDTKDGRFRQTVGNAEAGEYAGRNADGGWRTLLLRRSWGMIVMR